MAEAGPACSESFAWTARCKSIADFRSAAFTAPWEAGQANSAALAKMAKLVTQADETPAPAWVPPQPSRQRPLPQSRLPLLPPQEPNFRGKKTLVLDLDETLVHSSFTPVTCDLVLSVFLGTEEHKVYVRKRPGVDEFLKAVAKLYEVAIFTASTSLYANALLDVLDQRGWIQHRLFREACTRYKEGYVKDLSLLGRNLNDVIIVDNMPVCYALQPENAIPIRTWKHDPEDTELMDLLPILLSLAHVEEIPRMLKEILAYEASEDDADEAGAG
ncbi:PSR1 [Symbiodinium natans]|uniref:PSR1 protein n=1 Tax=Symbiodinium natans TaxID=878477 RepID=A0A812NTE1_9DINO|nr:PSR1 [Symbiodinium natans]